jgi:hypothetical protein
MISSPSPFIIGDAVKNGTFAGVSDGVIGFITKPGSVHTISGNYTFNNIKFLAPEILASANPPIPIENIKDYDIFVQYVFDPVELAARSATFFAIGAPGFTLQQLINIAKDTSGGEVLPSLDQSNAQKLLNNGLGLYMYLYDITTPRTKGQFIAQSLAETGSFQTFFETSGPGRGLLQLTLDENLERFGKYVGISGLSKRKDIVASNLALNIMSAMWFWSVFGKGGSEDLNAIAQNSPPNAVTVEKISRIVRGDSRNPNDPIPNDAHLPRRIEYFTNAVNVLSIT